jgi:GcrA cell cycle regulator
LPQPITNWTVDRVEELRKLWSEGYSCTQVASIMGNTTRNAVIGKINRLSLQSPKIKKFDSYGGRMQGRIAGMTQRAPKPKKVRQSIVRIVPANGNSAKMRVFRSSKTDIFPLRCVEIEPRNILLVDLEPGDCRYPYGDGPFTFCGHPAHEGSYCLPHFALSSSPGSPRERAATKVSTRILGAFA